jgi:UDP-3-O-[3-hydroxymyristoyl] N-acetylglucosamine deacetylase
MVRQRTLKKVVYAKGIGLHTGKNITITLRPAETHTGIVFRRIDVGKIVEIKAHVDNVGDTRLSTTLARGAVKISTVEHLLAAFAGLSIDNAYVDVGAEEIPIFDGSAWPFVELIQAAGIVKQAAWKRYIRIKRRISIREGDRWACFEPCRGFRLSFSIDFAHPVINQYPQTASVDLTPDTFVREISRARTFGFLRDLEKLRKDNLALGGNLSNAVVLDDHCIINEDGLRFEDEFVKHKILDAVGDLYLLGYNVLGTFIGHKSGHALNNKLIKTLLAERSAWDIVTQAEPEIAPVVYAPSRLLVVS